MADQNREPRYAPDDEGISPAVVAAENNVAEATATRWISRGVRVPGGRRVRLEARRHGGRWLTTRRWVREFLAELQRAHAVEPAGSTA